ncbi:ATP-binding protein [Amycolatopsis sp. QT-25]|uniref:ATP-binding protein n=1 Tax=Amycolatopsis sp. QT-25 TaxID=3034022 RepID=UPI0023EAE80A|nr:ATP-binding protein [Amycolatopsis sp. QT-25]WET77431.1 ATP-binding protein [Amycolatopsis sp. QT-25]
MTYDLDTTETRDVRHGVRQALARYRGLTVDDAVLVADELISNAHRHGDAPRTCRLELTHEGRYLRIEVDDASPRQPRPRTPDGSGGRGLMLIDRLASSWGVRNGARHKTVWAELALDREGSSGHAPHLAAARDWDSGGLP